MQINHYYPFGLNMEGNWNGSFPEAKNKYQYNEKELNVDFGLNWNDYGAAAFVAKCAIYEKLHGQRFKVPRFLKKMVANNETF